MRRHELTDTEWEQIKALLPERKARGRPPADPRRVLDGIFWTLGTGAAWRDLPERYGPFQTVHGWFSQWSGDGTFGRILSRLQVRLDTAGKIDWELFCIDGSSVRASRAAAGARKKSARANR
jgi:transposase